jgi:periplasmic divalent cation tolerance protein
MENACVVVTALNDSERSRTLAREMIEMRLAACVQVLDGAQSFYRWQGAVEGATESILWIKTSADRVSELRDWLLAHHPYELPEFLVLPVLGGSAAYLRWLAAGSHPEIHAG